MVDCSEAETLLSMFNWISFILSYIIYFAVILTSVYTKKHVAGHESEAFVPWLSFCELSSPFNRIFLFFWSWVIWSPYKAVRMLPAASGLKNQGGFGQGAHGFPEQGHSGVNFLYLQQFKPQTFLSKPFNVDFDSLGLPHQAFTTLFLQRLKDDLHLSFPGFSPNLTV